MAWGLGQPKTKVIGQGQNGIIVELGQTFRRYAEEVVHVTTRAVIAAVAMARTRARDTRVECSRERWNLRPIKVQNGPKHSLSGKRCCAVSKTETGIEEDLAAPPDREENRGHWIKNKPPIPALHIDLEYKHALVRILFASFTNKFDDGFGRWKSKLPVLAPVPVGINEGIDTPFKLGTVHHRPPGNRVPFIDSVEWTTKDRERKFGFGERADQGTEAGFSVNVLLYMCFEEGRSLEVPLRVFRFGLGD